MIDCNHCRDQLLELAMQPVDNPLPEEIQGHLDQCPRCRDELLVLRESWGALPSSLSTNPERTNRIEERVMQRIESTRRVQVTEVTRRESVTASDRRLNVWRYALAATVLVMLVAITNIAPILFYRNVGQLTEQERQQVRALAEQMNEIRRLESAFASADVRYVSLTSIDLASDHSSTRGHLVIDLESREAHLLASGLQPLSTQRYVIWLTDTNGTVLSSAIVKVNDERFGIASLPLPSDLAQAAKVVLTIEENEQPTLPSTKRVMQVDLAIAVAPR